ncbi:MAG: hypothetical protein JO015_02005 [Verrucomicrobia bacterium]|nr:hypothetical protein [Verrucomicrobiota bacterium]
MLWRASPALEKAIEELKALPPDRLAVRAPYIHPLTVPDLQTRRALLQNSGRVLSSEGADELERAGVAGLPED